MGVVDDVRPDWWGALGAAIRIIGALVIVFEPGGA